MSKMFNRARMTITSTGTGALTLGVAVTGYQTFSSAGVSNGDTVSYTIEDGVNWECGTGVFTLSGTTLSRTVTQSYNGSTYGTSPISVTTSAQVFITALAADLQSGTAAGNLVALDGSAKLPAIDGSQLTNVPVTATNFTGTLPVTKGGTGLTSLTAGYIPFGAGTSAFGNDSSLFWDNTNKRLGIGTSSPLYQIETNTSSQSIAKFNGAEYGVIRFDGGPQSCYIQNWTGISMLSTNGATAFTFGTNGTERMRIASDGSVGIGETSISSGVRLALFNYTNSCRIAQYGDTNHRQYIYNNPTSGAQGSGIGQGGYLTRTSGGTWSGTKSYAYFPSYNLYIANESNQGFSFVKQDNGSTTTDGAITELMKLDSVGNLGLGVTPSAWSTGKAISVAYSGSNIWSATESGNIFILSNAYYNGGYKYDITGKAASYYQQNSGIHAWYNAPSGTAGNAITFTQAMTLDASGNLGVGTTTLNLSSSTKSLSIGSSSASDYAALEFQTAGVLRAYMNATNGAFYIASQSTNPMVFYTNSSERARIDSSGNVTLNSATFSPASPSTAGNLALTGTVAMGSSFKRNRIINGNMQIWQRGTSGTAAGYAYPSVDRWAGGPFSAYQILSQSTSVPSTANFQYSLKVQRTVSQTSVAPIILMQTIESVNCYDLAGQTVTLSFYAKAGANYSSASSILNIELETGTTADQGGANYATWTSRGTPINTSITLTTSWQRFTLTGTVGAGVLEMAPLFYFIPVGTAGADDAFYITGVQLEVGSIATPYERQIYSDQLAQCMRYYINNSYVGGNGNTIGVCGSVTIGNNYFASVQFPVKMRVAPTTITFDSWANSAFGTTGTVQSAGYGGFNFYSAATSTSVSGYMLGGYTAAAEL